MTDTMTDQATDQANGTESPATHQSLSPFKEAGALLAELHGQLHAETSAYAEQLARIQKLIQLAETQSAQAIADANKRAEQILAEAQAAAQNAQSSTQNNGDGRNEEAEAARAALEDFITANASFTSLMVHEIRKPMTSIRGYSDMLAKPGLIGPLNDMQQQFVDTIRTNIIRMEGLVTDISDINKLKSGRMKLDSKMTAFSQVMLEVQKLAEPLITEYGHTVVYEVPQGLPFLTTDAKQLAKVTFALLKNAIQYTPKGTTEPITLRAEKTEDGRLRVSITDPGIGMKPEEMARLGEAFYRADHELVTQTKGYGLGIPVAMGFLQLMDSQLEYTSEPGKGSTFGYTLKGMS
jgi:signal transduction histidine kinase